MPQKPHLLALIALAIFASKPFAAEHSDLPPGPPPDSLASETTNGAAPNHLELSDLGYLKLPAVKHEFPKDYASYHGHFFPKAQLWGLPPEQEPGCGLASIFEVPEALIIPTVLVYSPDIAADHETLVIVIEWKTSERLWQGEKRIGRVIRYVYRPGPTYRTYRVEPDGKKSSLTPSLKSGPQLGIGIVF